ncbi:MAG TPA: STAS domain-containing protein [Candidatus Xenobia bacterium]
MTIEARRLRLKGEVSIFEAPALKHAVTQTLMQERGLVLDLSEVTFVDSGGAAVIAHAVRMARELGIPQSDVRLEGASRPIQRLLFITGLSQFFPATMPDGPDQIQ